MIYSVKSNKKSFKDINFKSGLNVIIAERTKESTIKDSRNGLGKSTLIEILNFCLGGKKSETLLKEEMNDWIFYLEMDISGKKYTLSRNISDSNNIYIEGDFSSWPITPQFDKQCKQYFLPTKEWNKLLGILFFNLDFSISSKKYTPSFRSLISYFIRRNGSNGGYLNPFQHYKKQLEWDIQVNNAYLLNLDWEFPSKIQILKDRKSVLKQIKYEADSGLLSNFIGDIGNLEASIIRLKEQCKQEEIQLKSFKIHPQYKQIETDSNNLTKEIHDLVNKNISEQLLIDYYESSLIKENEVDNSSVIRIYHEAGIIFSKQVIKNLEEVLSFHKQILVNRKSFLMSEINKLKNSILIRNNEIKTLSNKKAELMNILTEHSALEEHIKLQTNHLNTIAAINDINNRIELLKKYEQDNSNLTIETEHLHQQAIRDIEERKKQKEKAILLFNSNTEALYKTPGTLSINVSKTGYKFDVTINRSGSHGIGNMKIFCYDLMLIQIWSEKVSSHNFLIHDSTIFSDVDERQKALAIELAKHEAERRNFQYICTINSDAIPDKKDFSADFDINDHVRLFLTDAKEDGGLLGIRF